jgi:hypothetical protein
MTTKGVPFLTIDMERGRIEVHDAAHLGPRLHSNHFRFEPAENVWQQRFRNEAELLPILSWLISQRIALHEDVVLKPKHLDLLKPFLMVYFEGDGAKMKAVVEEVL